MKVIPIRRGDLTNIQVSILETMLNQYRYKWIKAMPLKLSFILSILILLYLFMGCAKFDPSQLVKTGVYVTVSTLTSSNDAGYAASALIPDVDTWDDLGCSTDTECMEMYGGNGDPEPAVQTER